MNLQVACTIYGKLAWISDPVNGSRHDNYCREESGVLLTINPRNWIGDKGYIGNNMITPFRKPAGGELLDWQKEYNSEVNKIRWMIEQVISHFKNWTIMRVRLFDRYEYLRISLMNRLYWESPGVSGCFRQCPQWLLLVSVVSVVRAGKGRDGIRPRVPRVRGPCPG